MPVLFLAVFSEFNSAQCIQWHLIESRKSGNNWMTAINWFIQNKERVFHCTHPWTALGLELGNCPCSPRLGGAPRSWSSKHRGQSSPVHVRPLTEWLGVYSTCFPVCKTVLLGLVSQGCSGISQPMWGKCYIVNACILESPSELSAHSFDYPQRWQTIFT